MSAYAFFVHVRHPAFRLIVKADALFPTETNRAEWRRTRVREAADVNAEVREAVDRDGYSLFKIGLKLSEMPKDWRNKAPLAGVALANAHEEKTMGRGILLWLLCVPIPVIILLWLFFGR